MFSEHCGDNILEMLMDGILGDNGHKLQSSKKEKREKRSTKSWLSRRQASVSPENQHVSSHRK